MDPERVTGGGALSAKVKKVIMESENPTLESNNCKHEIALQNGRWGRCSQEGKLRSAADARF